MSIIHYEIINIRRNNLKNLYYNDPISACLCICYYNTAKMAYYIRAICVQRSYQYCCMDALPGH